MNIAALPESYKALDKAVDALATARHDLKAATVLENAATFISLTKQYLEETKAEG